MPVSITKDTICNSISFDDPLFDTFFFDGENICPMSSTQDLYEIVLAKAALENHAFKILRTADLVSMEIMQDIGHSQYQFALAIRFRLKPEAFTAWNNLSNGADFAGGITEFAEKLVGYATLYQEALIDAEICPIEPYCSKMLDARKLDTDSWYQKLTPEYRRPALESILGWAGDTSTYCQLYNFLYDSGIDSMIEAYQAGVPIEDIIA